MLQLCTPLSLTNVKYNIPAQSKAYFYSPKYMIDSTVKYSCSHRKQMKKCPKKVF